MQQPQPARHAQPPSDLEYDPERNRRDPQVDAIPIPPPLPRAAYQRPFDPADCSGVWDGFGVVSDADPGL